MAYKAIFKTEGKEYPILTFFFEYFLLNHYQVNLVGELSKSKMLTLGDLTPIAEQRQVGLYPQQQPYGGVFKISVESTSDDKPLYEKFIGNEKHGTVYPIAGSFEFYKADDEFSPFRTIEFKDAYIIGISEYESTVSGSPMTLQLSISAGAVRFNKTEELIRSWSDESFGGQQNSSMPPSSNTSGRENNVDNIFAETNESEVNKVEKYKGKAKELAYAEMQGIVNKVKKGELGKRKIPKSLEVAVHKHTGDVIIGQNGTLNKNNALINPKTKEKFLEGNNESWNELNCSEADVVNQIFLKGNDPNDYEYHAVEYDIKEDKIRDKHTCNNCDVNMKEQIDHGLTTSNTQESKERRDNRKLQS